MSDTIEKEEKTKKLKMIRDEVWNFADSPLYAYRTSNRYYPVLGEGNHDATIVFVGEAPGKNEAEQGRPFCGAAGRILDELLAHAGFDRGDVYITNIVKDRPPDNRDPTPHEIALYGPFLDRQLAIIRPSVIAGLGRFSSAYIMERFGLAGEITSISAMHGKAFPVTFTYGNGFVVPLYHPAAAIYNRTTKEDLERDFTYLRKLYDDICAKRI